MLAGAKIAAPRLSTHVVSGERANQIVAQLERDAERYGERLESGVRRPRARAELEPELERTHHRVARRLQAVHLVEVLSISEHVELLADDRIELKLREPREQSWKAFSRDLDAGERSSGERQRVVTREHGAASSHVRRAHMRLERGVHGWPPTPDPVSIHPVIVNQKVRLQELYGRAHRDGRRPVARLGPESIAGGDQRRTQAFSSPQAQLAGSRQRSRDGRPMVRVLAARFLPQRLEVAFDLRPNLREQLVELLARGHCRLARRYAPSFGSALPRGPTVWQWRSKCQRARTRGTRRRVEQIPKRKDEHLDLATHGDVGFRRKTSLLECVELVHEALPELSLDELDLGVRIFGRKLRAPLIIVGMTGGTERARTINLELAALAEERGYGFGLGSQRAMLADPALLPTYEVRQVAPSTLLLGNIGAVQAARMSTAEAAQLVDAIAADALCVHLNPAMEIVQSEGDRNFRGIEATFQRLSAELPVPVVAKETGCGLSVSTARRLRTAGVRDVDVSGAGGTSWVAVEAQRGPEQERSLGERLWDWGIPTAASLLCVAPAGFRTVIATGGIATGLDAARALVLGAHAVGIARPVLQALERGGREGARSFLEGVERELRSVLLLMGARDVAAARGASRLLTGELALWEHLVRG